MCPMAWVLTASSWVWITGGVILLLLVASALWWWVPKWQMRSIVLGDPKARADIEDNFRKTVGQALGGIAVLIGAGTAYLQFTQQQEILSKQIAVQQEAAANQVFAQL